MGKCLSILSKLNETPDLRKRMEHCTQPCAADPQTWPLDLKAPLTNDMDTTQDCQEPADALPITLIPPEVLYPEILDRLPTRDLLAFAATSHAFHNAIVDHPTFWRSRLFQFSLTETQRRHRVPACGSCGGYACFRCDNCNASPLQSERHTCIVCQVYDLCGDCFRANAHGHDPTHELVKAPNEEESALQQSVDDIVKHTLTVTLRPLALSSITTVDLDQTNVTAISWPLIMSTCSNLEVLSSRTCLCFSLQELETLLTNLLKSRPNLRLPRLRVLRAKGAKDHWSVDRAMLRQIHLVVRTICDTAVFDVCKCTKCCNVTAMDPMSDPCRRCGDTLPVCVECIRQCAYCLVRYCDGCERVMNSIKGEFFIRSRAGNFHCQGCHEAEEEEFGALGTVVLVG